MLSKAANSPRGLAQPMACKRTWVQGVSVRDRTSAVTFRLSFELIGRLLLRKDLLLYSRTARIDERCQKVKVATND